MTPDEYDQCRELYQGYADFYHVALTKDGAQKIWSWLFDDGHVCTGLVAEKQGQLVEFVHFCGMQSLLNEQMIGFLDDLFVVPDHCSGVAAAVLIKAVQAETKTQGWGVVRWITCDHNYRARGLYDRLSEKTNWVLYEMTEMVAK